MVGEFDGLVVESVHSFVDQLSVLLVARVDVQIVLRGAVQPASNVSFTSYYYISLAKLAVQRVPFYIGACRRGRPISVSYRP